ncbi:helix-turn-helix domain-containing protein [Luteibacter yeojuensis]|uniref:helix-turn-helix domain-containing protein n=1 Tax=Luteibacter yeojuensis TaxID=345309 RepID=UPI003D18C279
MPPEFYLAFKGTFGADPTQVLRALRMSEACARLRAGEAIVDLAGALGYRSVKSFGKAFRVVMGQPPARWRRALSQCGPASARQPLSRTAKCGPCQASKNEPLRSQDCCPSPL